MDKNLKNKVKDFFRKEGFYIVLFLCICIIATVTAISYKMSNSNTKPKNNATEEELTLKQEDNITGEIPNAERVENDVDNNELASTEDSQEVTEETSETASVNAVIEVEFLNPIEGTISRKFSSTPIKYHETEDRVTYKTVNGIDIKSSIGTEVKAAADGIIEVVLKDPSEVGVEDGVNVVILHANGMRTKYSNLDADILVNEGDKVTVGTVIGKVGATSALFKEGFDEHLNLQVIDNDGQQVDPLEYFSY